MKESPVYVRIAFSTDRGGFKYSSRAADKFCAYMYIYTLYHLIFNADSAVFSKFYFILHIEEQNTGFLEVQAVLRTIFSEKRGFLYGTDFLVTGWLTFLSASHPVRTAILTERKVILLHFRAYTWCFTLNVKIYSE